MGTEPARPRPTGAALDILTIADVLASRGGLELLQTELCSELSRRGHRVGVVHRGGGDLEPAWRAFARPVRRVRAVAVGRRPGRALLSVAAAVPRCWAVPADVVYVHYFEHLELAWLAAGAGRRPIVAHLHLRGPAGLGPYGRRLVRGADRYIAISAAVADGWARAGVPPDRITVVHNGVDTSAFTPAPPARRRQLRARFGLRSGDFVVAYAGRMVAHKGASVLVAAMDQVRRAHPGSQLLLAGPGEAPGPLPDGVRHLGAVARDDVVALLQLADVVAVPTIEFDGCPLVVAEALACGVPVVATSVGGIPEQLTGELAQWLVPPGRPDALAEALGSLKGWRERRPELASLCRSRALAAFSRPRMVAEVEAVLLEAVAVQR